MKKKNPEWNEIDNKYELIAYLIKRHWWKVVIIIITAGVMVTGFTCGWQDISIKKDPIYERRDK
jgi:hypothetical protein